MMDHDIEMEERIRNYFWENFETLRLEGGHSLSPDTLNTALQQVLLYWRKLRHIAEKVTETEVRLTLPEQQTPEGRRYGIEGVVDIVREDGRTTMYDIKTHDADFVRGNVQEYAKQLNVYAYIWQELRGQDLDETAIISTALPGQLKDAFSRSDAERLAREMGNWEPLIGIPFDAAGVAATIEDFGRTVDAIETHQFAPPPAKVLESKAPGTRSNFATFVCHNCDARFSCDSYRQYAGRSRRSSDRAFRVYYQDVATEAERDEWAVAGLEQAEQLRNRNDLP